jgi:K+-transporting ATPase KdpF subunit
LRLEKLSRKCHPIRAALLRWHYLTQLDFNQGAHQAMACFAAARKGAPDVGRRHAGAGAGLLRGGGELRLRLRTALRGTIMIFDYSLAGLVSAGLLVYLTYALLRPERF